MRKTSLRKIPWPTIIFIVILLYLAALLFNYFHFDFNKHFGYLDYQLYWQNLSNLANGKVIYRDFFWEYGLLYLVIGLPFFLVLGKTFLASILIRLLILPIIGIFLSYLLSKQLLKKGFLVLFLLLLFLYGVNNDFTSFRHLLPELGLIILFVGLGKNNRQKAIWGSLLIGLSLTSSVEYGIAAIISIGFYFFISFFRKPAKSVFRQIVEISIPIILIAASYFLFLWKTGALKNFLIFTIEYAQSFYYNSPCRELFPRLSEFNFNLINLQKLNLYFVPLFLAFFLGWAITKRKAKWFPIITPLLIYSFLIFYRVLATPCVGYLSYGLTFLFLILVFALSQSKSKSKFRLIVWLIIAWFLVIGFLSKTSEYLSLYKTKIKAQEMTETTILPIAQIKLEKKLADEYQQIANFIKEKSKKDDYLYVYPNGPYNQLAERKSPVSTISTWYYALAPSLIETTYHQLSQKKPKLVIVNTYNAWGMKSLLNNLTYNLHSENQEIIFEGLTTEVEDFIAENYQIVKKFEIAWILAKRTEPKSAKKLYLPGDEIDEWQISSQGLSQNPYLNLDKSINFEVIQNKPLIQINSTLFNQVEIIKIPIKVNLGISKPFSKFIINVYALTNEDKNHLLTRQFVTSDWQDVWVYMPKFENSVAIKSIIISISNNKGFFWWGKPKNIGLKQLEAFVPNQSLKIDDSAF